MIKIVIADDEKALRLVLRKALDRCPQVEVLGEAKDGAEAVALVEELKPDAVFLDVDMPNLSGIEAAKLILDIKPDCMVVFVTAHQEYMSEAFQLYAFDYMLKPFKLDRLEETIGRMQSQLQPIQVEVPEVVEEEHEAVEGILIKTKEGMSIVTPKDIVLIQREDRHTVIITEEDHYITGESLTQIESKLPAQLFLRCHKSYIVQLSKIKRLSPYGRWTYIVKLKGIKEDALITKSKLEQLEEIFNTKIGG